LQKETMKKPNTPPPEPPAGLSGKSQCLWRAVIDRATNVGRQALLAEALRALDRADQCHATVDAEGLTKTTVRTGAIHVHPLLAMEERFRRQFSTGWMALGFEYHNGTSSPFDFPDEV
jgi:hypothetical protein